MLKNILPFGDKHRDPYAEHIIYEHRNFDVKGLTTQGVYTLELAQVFVELGLGPQTVEQASADPIRPMPQTLQQGRHSIWEYLTSRKMKGQPLVVLGPPGSGKTTLLKHLAISLAPAKPDKTITQGYDRLPILLFLRNHAQIIRENPRYSLLDAIQAEQKKWEISLPTGWFQDHLKKGACLVMLDGLDEVADLETRRHVVAWVEKQLNQHAQNQFVISSRPFGYRVNPLQRAVVLEVHPFSITQVESFVHNWYLANEIMSTQREDPGVRMQARQGADDLIWRLRRAHVLLDMAVNPLLLTMIATVHRYRSSLPGRRVELYAEICEVFLGKRQQARGIVHDLTPAQKQRVLQPLAYYMMQQKQREIARETAVSVIKAPLSRVSPQTAGEQFLEMIVNSSGLLVEREVGVYSFAHLTFQEFLAAAHVQDRKLERELITHVDDTWWHETIRLYAAQVDATNIVRACLMRRQPSIQALTLAMECLDEAREVQSELRNIFERLERSVDNQNPEVRRISAEVTLALRMKRLVRLDEDRAADNLLVTHAEYQLFLEDMLRQDKYHHPDHWQSNQFVVGQGRHPVAGMRPFDALAFCEWLTDKEQGEWMYRLPKSNELEVILANSEAEETAQLPRAFWYVSRSGFETYRNGLVKSLPHTQLQESVMQRFYDDWRLHPRLPHLKKAGELLHKQVLSRAFTMSDLDRNFNLDRLQSPDIVQDVNLVRDRATRTRVQTIDQALNYINAFVQRPSSSYGELQLDNIVQLAQRVATDIDHAKQLSDAPQQARLLVQHLERAQAHVQVRDQILPTPLLRALNASLLEANNLLNSLYDAHMQARKRVRMNAILFINDLIQDLSDPNAANISYSRQQMRQLLQAYVDLYLDFAMLEARIGQQLPALEGIRIVRERKQPITTVH